MKKQLSALSILLLLTSVSYAQGVYFRLGGGYGLPMASETLGEKYVELQDQTGNNNSNTATSEAVKGSYGAGANVNLGGGFMFSKHFGIDLNFQYLMSKKYQLVENYFYTSNGFSARETDEITSSAKAFFITPSFVITAPLGSHSPYGRFGVVVGVPKITHERDYYFNGDGTAEQKWIYEDSKGSAFGFQGTVGMNWGLSNKIGIFTEVNFISLTYYAGQSELVTFTNDGEDRLDDVPIAYKKIEYKKEVSIDYNDAENLDEPMQALRRGTPFSSISLHVGIIYFLGGRSVE